MGGRSTNQSGGTAGEQQPPAATGGASGERSREALPPSVRTLMFAFAGVAVAFLISTVAAEYRDIEIRRAANRITGKAAPSVRDLAGLRAHLQNFALRADDEVDTGIERFNGPMTSELGLERQGVDVAWAAYRALPVFPGEIELQIAAERAKAHFDAAATRLIADITDGRWPSARATMEQLVKPSIAALDAAVLRLVVLDTNQGAALARQIDDLGRQSILIAVVTDGLSVLLTVLTAILLWRVVRRYTSIVERRAEELELFAGRVAHDVLGPLGAASLALEMAEREVARGSRTQRMIASGKAGLRRARSIADGLLEFARAGAKPQPGSFAEVLDVVRAVVEEVEPAAQERAIEIAVEAPRSALVACSQGILASVVSNLVRNAVKYAGEGPRKKRIVVRVRPSAGWVRIEVEDNGRGLPPGLGDHAFEPYVRGLESTEPGIGLGLATVKKVVDAHGGRVDVRSVPGLGCRFGIELPAARETPSRSSGRSARADRGGPAADQPAFPA